MLKEMNMPLEVLTNNMGFTGCHTSGRGGKITCYTPSQSGRDKVRLSYIVAMAQGCCRKGYSSCGIESDHGTSFEQVVSVFVQVFCCDDRWLIYSFSRISQTRGS